MSAQINDLSLKMSVFVWEGGNKTMPNMNYPESDWKLFRSKISDWQEAYVEAMIELEEVHRKEKHGNKG